MHMIGLAAGYLFTATSIAWAQAPYDDERTPEGWAWKRIRQNEIADFQNRCGQLNPQENTGWDAACRRISLRFVVDLLTNSKFMDQVPPHGVGLRGVSIIGTIDLAGAETKSQLWIHDSRIEGDVILTDSHWARRLALVGSAVHGDVILRGAKVGSNLEMDTSSFAKTVNGNSLTVDGALFMRNHATFSGDVILNSAKVGSNSEMDTSNFAKTVNGNRLTVEGSLFMRDHATFSGDVILNSAKVGSNLEMDTSNFAKTVDGYGLTVGSSLFMRFGAGFKGSVVLTYAKVARLLDLREAKAWTFDFSDGRAGEIQMGGLEWWCADGKPLTGVPGTRLSLGDPRWRGARCDGAGIAVLPKFILRNAQVDAFQDSADAWPSVLDLEGFRYDRLGGFGSTLSTDMLRRSPDEWTDWLARDRTFSNQPYTQLGSVLAQAGYRDPGNDIQFAGREREREEVCKRSDELGTCAWLTHL